MYSKYDRLDVEMISADHLDRSLPALFPEQMIYENYKIFARILAIDYNNY